MLARSSAAAPVLEAGAGAHARIVRASALHSRQIRLQCTLTAVVDLLHSRRIDPVLRASLRLSYRACKQRGECLRIIKRGANLLHEDVVVGTLARQTPAITEVPVRRGFHRGQDARSIPWRHTMPRRPGSRPHCWQERCRRRRHPLGERALRPRRLRARALRAGHRYQGQRRHLLGRRSQCPSGSQAWLWRVG